MRSKNGCRSKPPAPSGYVARNFAYPRGEASRRSCAISVQKSPPPAGITTMPGRISAGIISEERQPVGELARPVRLVGHDDGDLWLDCRKQATEVGIGVSGDIGRGPGPHQRSIAVAHLEGIALQLRKLRSNRHGSSVARTQMRTDPMRSPYAARRYTTFPSPSCKYVARPRMHCCPSIRQWGIVPGILCFRLNDAWHSARRRLRRSSPPSCWPSRCRS